MNVRSLQYLLELEKAGSIYAAAKKIGLSQQGLSRSIASLEQELGVELVRRTKRGSYFTDAGMVVLDSARKIVAEHEKMTGLLFAMESSNDRLAYRINVFVSHYSAEIASIDPEYVRLLSTNTFYAEEPFDKLLLRAESSDGTDLVFTDVFGKSMARIDANPAITFDPVIQTRYGIAWKNGADFQKRASLHRSEVANLCIAVDTNREAMLMADMLFEHYPLASVRMGTSSRHMLMKYVQMSETDVVALCDSFYFYLMEKSGAPEVRGLHFTPFATLKAMVQVGFILPTEHDLSRHAAHTMRVLRRYISENCPEYA